MCLSHECMSYKIGASATVIFTTVLVRGIETRKGLLTISALLLPTTSRASIIITPYLILYLILANLSYLVLYLILTVLSYLVYYFISSFFIFYFHHSWDVVVRALLSPAGRPHGDKSSWRPSSGDPTQPWRTGSKLSSTQSIPTDHTPQRESWRGEI